MSTSIDQRVVEMRFDNQHFERNVATSMSTLDKLKQKLRLSGATKGLEDIDSATKKVNMGVLGTAVETVSAKFSALQVMGVTALANITNSAVNAGKNIVKSLTIDPIMSGFSEYETKMGSIQTILANTEHQGTTLDDVVKVLDELNLYADKTIYNFQEMTRNIGTFTAAGVDLETSVKSIQGIANLAAVSGSTSQQASTAMYQLSQALASGTVKLMDWNSVVNAGMGGKVFQNALIRTAAVLDGSANDVAAWQKKNIDAYGSFRDSLSQGAWLTTEVLTATLEQFTMAAEEGSEEWEAYKKSLMETGYTAAQAEEILKMANTATDAATKVKTFTQLMDTLKESAQSGWAQTWELLIGDFEEAKAFFTQLSDIFGGIIGESADRRNNLLGGALNSNWDKLTANISEAGHQMTEFEESIRTLVGDDVLDPLIEKYGSLEKAVKSGAISSDILKKALDGIGVTSADSKISSIVEGLKSIERILRRGSVGDEVKKLQTALDALGYDLGAPGIDGIIGPITEAAIKEFQKANGLIVDGIAGPETIAALEKAANGLGEVTGETNTLRESCDALIDDITKKGGRELLLESLLNIIKAIHRPLAAVGEAFRNTFSVSSDQVYNLLEGFNKFTDALVMKGPLDATNWTELSKSLQAIGVDMPTFMSKLTDALKTNGVDVDALIEKYGSLGEAFNNGAISMDTIKEVLLGFKGVSETLLEGGETADKLRRTFEGLFAILEIIGTFATNGLSVAFRILKAILGAFDMDILGFTASVGDAIVAFRDWLFETNSIAKLFDWLISKLPVVINKFRSWFDVFKQTPVIQDLIAALRGIGEAFTKFFAGEIDSTELARTLGSNLAKALVALPKIAIQIGRDFIAGFKNGATDSITGVIDKIVNFCLEFVRAFASALGVQSPSWKAYEIMCDFFQGAINGAGAMISKVVGVLKTIGEKILDVFRQIWDLVTDESGNIEWGKLFSGGILIAVAWFLKQITTAVGGVGSIAEEFAGLVDQTTKTMKSFKKVLNAYAWDLKAQALQKLAIGLAILVGALWLLTTIDDPGKLLIAVGVVAALAGILFLLAWAMSKMSEASMTINKEGINVKGLKSSLAQIGIAVLLMAAVVKLFGSMSPDELSQGLGVLAGMALGLVAFVAVLGVVSRYSRDADKIGKMLTKITFAMLLMVGVVKLVDCLSADEMSKAAIFATAFGLFAAALIAVSKGAGNNVSKVGGLMLKLTVALGLMVGVVKLISLLSLGEMGKGALFAAGFTVFVKSLMNTAKIGKKQQLAKLGGLVLSIAAALVLIAGVVKIIGGMSVGELLKGTLFVAAFAGIVWALVHFVGGENAHKMSDVSKSISGMVTAIALLAVVAIALSFVPVDGLIRGVAAVAVLGLIMAAMIKALQGAQSVTGSLWAITIAIAIMATAIGLLSFVDPGRLMVATGAMTILMGMFALIEKCSKSVTQSVWTLIVMTGAIGAIAFILALLANSVANPDAAIKVAIGVGILITALVLSMKALEKVGNIKLTAVGGLLVMTGVLALVAFIMSSLVQNGVLVGPSIETAVALGILIAALAASVAVLGFVKQVSVTAMIAIGVMAVVLAGLMWVMKLLAQDGTVIGPSIETAISMSILLVALAGVTAILAALGGAAVGAILGALGLAGVVVVIGALMVALGALNKYWPDMETFLDDGIVILEKIGAGIGKFVGGLVGGIGEGLMDSVVSMVETFGVAVDKLAVVAESAAGIDATSFDGVGAFIDLMGQIGLTTVGTTLSDIFTLGGTSMEKFSEDGVAFFKAMKKIAKTATGIELDEASFDAVVKAATKLTDLQDKIEPIGGLADALMGSDDLGTFGVSVNNFITQIKTAFSNVTGFTFDSDALANIISAASELSTLQHDIEAIGGVVDWFTGRDDLGAFGKNVGDFINEITLAFEDLSGFTFDSAALANIISAASELSTLQHDLEAIGGVVDWFTGRDDLGKFGENVYDFLNEMIFAFEDLDGFAFDSAALANIISAASELSTLQHDIEAFGGVVEWFTGADDLGAFGENVSEFASAMEDAFFYLDDIEVDTAVIDNVIDVCKTFTRFVDYLNQQELDYGDVSDLTGIGWFQGWFGADGPMSKIGEALADFEETLSGIRISKVQKAVTAASDLVSVIGKVSTISTKGVDAFTGRNMGKKGYDGDAHVIAGAIKDFHDTLGDIDTTNITNAVTAADGIASLINKVSCIDTSGVDTFVGVDGDGVASRIANAFSDYATGMASVDAGAILRSTLSVQALINTIANISSLDGASVDGFTKAVNDLAGVNFDGFVEAFSGEHADLSTAGADIVGSIAKGIVKNLGAITEAMARIKLHLVSALGSMDMLFILSGMTTIGKFVKGITSKEATVSKTVATIVLKASQTARVGYASFFSAGMYLVTGFANGIKANTFRAEARARVMAQAAVNAAKKVLDIHSPSRVGYAIGDFFGIGFVNAIGDHVKTAYRSSAEMAGSAKQGLKDSISKISDLISSDMDAQPTIRPVLDLSDVRAGAGAIGSLLGADSSIGVMSNLNSISTMMNRRGQNGGTGEVISAIDRLRKDLGNVGGTSYNINGITYDRGSELDDAIRTIVRYARIEGRV